MLFSVSPDSEFYENKHTTWAVFNGVFMQDKAIVGNDFSNIRLAKMKSFKHIVLKSIWGSSQSY